MAELLERSLGEQITLTTSLEHTPRTVVADPSEVENAILNLAINARDAMPHGGKLIIETANMTFDEARVDAGTRIDAGQYVRLSATDTGVGMAQDIVRKAFEPFFTTKETGKGTGLGLSTIYGFVRQAGGVVTIYSEVGCGTTVNIYLPRAELERGRDAGGKAHTSVASAAGERILLVEDDADVRAVTEAQFEALGYAVTAVASGPEAVSVLSLGAAFDLIFSDVVMPGGMSGFDLARWVATHVPNLKIILASGYPDAALNTEPSEGNRPDILKKPFNRSELARALRRVLDSNVG